MSWWIDSSINVKLSLFSWIGTILSFQGFRTNGFNTASNVDVIRTDAIKLATSASTVDNQYNGMRIKLTSIDAEGDYTIQEREIVDYDGSTKIAQVDRTWDKDRFPKDPRSDFSGYTYKYEILAPKDVRVSTNPSIQLLDYMIFIINNVKTSQKKLLNISKLK